MGDQGDFFTPYGALLELQARYVYSGYVIANVLSWYIVHGPPQVKSGVRHRTCSTLLRSAEYGTELRCTMVVHTIMHGPRVMLINCRELS